MSNKMKDPEPIVHLEAEMQKEYQSGYQDGYNKAVEDFAEWVFSYTDGYYFKSKQELLEEWNKK